ncbi:MAG: sugar transferase [Patescibacteria group bacterium]
MKKFELAFNVLAVFLDAIMIYLAGFIAYFFRYRLQSLFPQYPIMFDLSFAQFSKNILIAIPFLLAILSAYGLYKVLSTDSFWKISAKIFASISTGLMMFVAIYFFDAQIFPSRLIVLMSWLYAIVLVSFGRLTIMAIQGIFLKRGIGLHKLALIVDPQNDFNLIKEISSRPELGYKIVKILPGGGELTGELDQIRKEEGIDEIIQANFKLDRKLNAEVLKFTHDYGIKFTYVPDIIGAQSINIATAEIAGIPVIHLKNTPLEGWGKVVKRVTDIFISLVAIILASPLFALVALGIRLDSPGPVFFIQERYGQGRPFRFYKFRSMYKELSVGESYGGEKAQRARNELWKSNARHGPFLKIKNDPRVTRFGRFIRATKLDELPQFLSVLKGDMSLIGPRAHVLDEVDRYRDTYKRQFTVKPGITGLTQITQARIPDLPFEEEIRLDTFYLENWSFLLDFKILFRTIAVVLHPPKRDQNY